MDTASTPPNHEESAQDLLQRYLEARLAQDELTFAAFVDQHPAQAEELRQLGRGLGLFLAVQREASGPVPVPSTHGVRRLAVAALLLVSLGGFVVWLLRSPAPEATEGEARTRLLALTQDRVQAFLDPPRWSLLESSEQAADLRVELGFWMGEVDRLAEDLSGVELSASDASLLSRVSQLRAESGERVAALDAPFQEEVRAALEGRRPPTSVALDTSLALRVQLAPIAGASTPAGQRADQLRQSLQFPGQLSFAVYDLDRDGDECSAQIQVREVDPLTGRVGGVRTLGQSPLVTTLEPGDWQVTAWDAAGRRQGHLRVLVRPGDKAMRHVLFLRRLPLDLASMVQYPGGTFPYGAPGGYGHVRERMDQVAPFRLDRYETTNAQYAAFLREAMAHPAWYSGDLPDWPRFIDSSGSARAGYERHPVVEVSWRSAVRYACWAGKRLPTDREWEFAAGGTVGRSYPWGEQYDASRILRGVIGVPPPTLDWAPYAVNPPWEPVDARPRGATPEGVERLADNVSEWVQDIAVLADGDLTSTVVKIGRDGRNVLRVARGANWAFAGPPNTMVDVRAITAHQNTDLFLGFRCAYQSAFASR